MLRLTLPFAAAAALLAACAPGAAMDVEPSPEAAATLANFTATGETETCLNTRLIDRIEPLDERHWLVEMRGGDVYLNRVSGGCNGADRTYTYLQYQTSGSQLCRGEIVRVIDNGSNMLAGSCVLGDYERLTPVTN